MATLVISEKLLQQLQAIAEREQRSVEELAEAALVSFVRLSAPIEAPGDEPDEEDLLLKIAHMADERGWSSGITDISETMNQQAEEAIAKHFSERQALSDAETDTDR